MVLPCFKVRCNIPPKHLTEIGLIEWPQHVGGYAECNNTSYLYMLLLVISHKNKEILRACF